MEELKKLSITLNELNNLDINNINYLLNDLKNLSDLAEVNLNLEDVQTILKILDDKEDTTFEELKEDFIEDLIKYLIHMSKHNLYLYSYDNDYFHGYYIVQFKTV